MNASPFSPSEKHIDKILAILRDSRYHPVYFHCKFGRDRTSIIAALYKMYFQGLSEPEAMQYLHESGYGFKFGRLRSGLPAVRMTNSTRICVAIDSTNHPLRNRGALA